MNIPSSQSAESHNVEISHDNKTERLTTLGIPVGGIR